MTPSQELAQQCHREVVKLPESWQVIWLRLTGQPHTSWWTNANAGVGWDGYRIYTNHDGRYAPFIAGRSETWIDKPHLLLAVEELIKMFAHDHGLQL